jgi:hypothetical protein
VARHGRLYFFTPNGALQTFDCEYPSSDRLEKAGAWRGERLPHWRVEDVGSVRIQVSETLVYTLHRGRLYGFDAGTGALLFDLAVEGLRHPQALVSQDRLLLVGVSNDQHLHGRLYDVAQLCSGEARENKPIWPPRPEEGRLPASVAADADLSLRTLSAAASHFYVVSPDGQLFRLPAEGGEFLTLYDNPAARPIHAWNVGTEGGALLMAPGPRESRWVLVTFPTGAAAGPVLDESLYEIKPHERCRHLLTWKTDVLLLDQGGVLHQLPAGNPNDTGASWPLLEGLHPQEIYEPLLIPWAGRGYVLFHVLTERSHRFRYVGLHAPHGDFGAGLDVTPQARDQVRVEFSGINALVSNLSSGQVERVPLEAPPAAGEASASAGWGQEG